jgi:hypothetical protein
MDRPEDHGRSSFPGTPLLAFLTFFAIAGALFFFVPLWACPGCDRRGTVSARDCSDPNWFRLPKRLIDVPCWDCGGKGRLTPYRKWTWVQPSLSNK